MPPEKKTTRVRSHTRSDGTKVRSYNREDAWRQARHAWIGTGISLVTTTALIFQMGMTIVSTIALVVTALLGFAAVWASSKATENQRKMRANVQASRRGSSSRSRPGTRSGTRSRSSSSRSAKSRSSTAKRKTKGKGKGRR